MSDIQLNFILIDQITIEIILRESSLSLSLSLEKWTKCDVWCPLLLRCINTCSLYTILFVHTLCKRLPSYKHVLSCNHMLSGKHALI